MGNILKPLKNIGDGIGSRILDCIPNSTINTSDRCNRIGNALSRPDVNRLVMGGTAVVTQPFFDYYNPDVDEDTAKTSACRTLGKILAGTFVGCIVRNLCYRATEVITNVNPGVEGFRSSFLPTNEQIVKFQSTNQLDWLKKYRNGLSTIIGLVVMLFTNFLFDAPLTNKITNKLLTYFNLKEAPDKNEPKNPDTTNPNVIKDKPNNPVDKMVNAFDRLHQSLKGGA